MLEHLGAADVIYSRWTQGSFTFPYSPYNRRAHLEGLDFVGTEVLLSAEARQLFEQLFDGDVVRTLGLMAARGSTFCGIQAVTYERVNNAV